MASNSIKRSALAVALGLCFAGSVHAQSTTGTLAGTASAGDTITVVSETGFTRTVAVGKDGKYALANLPVGNYSVTDKKGDAVVGTKNALVRVGAAIDVSFAATTTSSGENNLGTITVTGQNNAIDVTQVDSRVVLTSKDLARLPIGRNAESVALLAPGAVQGDANIQSSDGRAPNTVSFGGAGVTENAYYINGYNSTDPVGGLGGVGLPYGSIAQQETYIGGYSAMYGRSDGGVINQVGKRGSNQWHFGGQLIYSPASLNEDPKDVYYPHTKMPPAQAGGSFDYEDPSKPGTLYRPGKGSRYETKTYSAYIGGPLIPDKLFFFLSAEKAQTDRTATPNTAGQPVATKTTTYSPKFYGKLDWNINSSNIVEFSWIKNTTNSYYDAYDYDFSSNKVGAFNSPNGANKYAVNVMSGKYTSYLSEDMTLNVMYGKSVTHNPYLPVGNTAYPFISGATSQNKLLNGGTPIRNPQLASTGASTDGAAYTNGLRVDLNWRLGNHNLTGGIDNMHYEMQNQGTVTYGAGYYWAYSRIKMTAGQPGVINQKFDVALPASEMQADGYGYYVTRGITRTATGSKVDQTAYYLEDAWSITDRFLLKLGIRNDVFTNRNSLGTPYVQMKNQWAPRVGFSWDMNGDSTSKLYGNVGRYFLALPPSVAIRGASASTITREYFTYSAINPDGTPVTSGHVPTATGPVSTNGEYGTPVDPNTVTAKGLKAQYQDEFILGFDKKLSANWNAGVKGTYRVLRSAIDDFCYLPMIQDHMAAQGLNPDDYSFPGDGNGCYIINPGKTNTFQVNRKDGTGHSMVTLTNEELGFNTGPSRKYTGLDLYLERPFDGKWSLRVDYTWARLTGNTEGQVKSDTGQGDTSKTSDWDYGQLMEYSSGVLQNDRTHQLKLRGTWQFARDWLLNGTANIMSGRPKNCLGFYGTNEDDPAGGYGSYMHWCGGSPSTPGAAGRGPWSKVINLGVQYQPVALKKKLTIGLDVFNAFNDRSAISFDPNFETDPYTISNTYGMGQSFTTPRRVQFSVTYDY
ncbi:MAG: TonB-dependent receptor [Proteobacteria bacterium]|nr:TonB-dependent receptor [Pseudomonadota bacterium]